MAMANRIRKSPAASAQLRRDSKELVAKLAIARVAAQIANGHASSSGDLVAIPNTTHTAPIPTSAFRSEIRMCESVPTAFERRPEA